MTSTLTTTQLAALPRVNLLPPEIEEQRKFRQVQIGLGAAVLAAVVGVGVLFVTANNTVSDAQAGLDSSKARQTQLENQTAQYAEVPLVQAQVEAANAQLDQAVGQKVLWSYVLNDISLRIPNHVWLTKMTVAQNVDGAAGNLTPGTYLPTGIGTVGFEGRGYGHNDVAAWLNALAKQTGFTQPYFTDSTVEAVGDDENAVKFSSSVTITDDALAKNYLSKAGS